MDIPYQRYRTEQEAFSIYSHLMLMPALYMAALYVKLQTFVEV